MLLSRMYPFKNVLRIVPFISKHQSTFLSGSAHMYPHFRCEQTEA